MRNLRRTIRESFRSGLLMPYRRNLTPLSSPVRTLIDRL